MSDLKKRIDNPNLSPFEKLVEVMRILRSAEGCAWDRAQTHKTLIPYLIEEAHEVIDSIEKEDYGELKGELGDLLCQVVFHAQLAAERGDFTADDAAQHIVDKLVHRHPHVFGERKDLNPQEVRDQWEKRKIETGERDSVLSGIPSSMPALMMAFRIGEKAGGVGFDWQAPLDVLAKVREELEELEHEILACDQQKTEEEIGDLLFAVASLARKLKVDPESALKRGLAKFRERFGRLEKRVLESGRPFRDFSLDDLESIWQEVK
ncbi:MAG: nucleoside triphosphate pyrophosphohydrolase [Candidatus Zixiibacteriota bacterium]